MIECKSDTKIVPDCGRNKKEKDVYLVNVALYLTSDYKIKHYPYLYGFSANREHSNICT